ncbi:hypothetical protein GCK32_015965 [Trichostrongylus colubriformis]|uniref:Uncharacterized protein n=1 Tax=Trichostrongylus colubriformis TaxID=6319 RepID=A0AAN8EML3_TRICO
MTQEETSAKLMCSLCGDEHRSHVREVVENIRIPISFYARERPQVHNYHVGVDYVLCGIYFWTVVCTWSETKFRNEH